VAITLKVYAVPLVRPVTAKGDDAPVVLYTPQFAYAVNEEIAPPPTHAGAVNATLTVPLVAESVAVPIVGALATFRALYPGKTIPA
jgi:hypothetical protein